MTAIALLESLESRGINLRLAGGAVLADFAPGALRHDGHVLAGASSW